MNAPDQPQRRASDAAVRRFALLTDEELSALATLLDWPSPDDPSPHGDMLDEIIAEVRLRASGGIRHRWTYGVCLDSVMPDSEKDEFAEPVAAIARAEQLRAEHQHVTVAIHLWPMP